MSLGPAAEADYYGARGFDEQHAAEVRSFYLPYVEGRRLLVELGCGRGEFLSLAQPIVEQVCGVDVDPKMVQLARARGFTVIEDDVRSYLRQVDDNPDTFFAAHLIEHFSVQDAFGLLTEVHHALAPDGLVILATPNPACLAMLTNDFWSDPTHVRLYTPELLRFLLQQAGFEIVDEGGNPNDTPGPPPHLLAADLLEPWGSLADTLGDAAALPEVPSEGVRELSDEVLLLRHIVVTLDERLRALRHVAGHAIERHNDTLRFLYGANEIFVVARRLP